MAQLIQNIFSCEIIKNIVATGLNFYKYITFAMGVGELIAETWAEFQPYSIQDTN